MCNSFKEVKGYLTHIECLTVMTTKVLELIALNYQRPSVVWYIWTIESRKEGKLEMERMCQRLLYAILIWMD